MTVNLKQYLLVDLGKAFVPQRWRLKLREFLLKAGITKEPYTVFSVLFHLSTFLTFVIYALVLYPSLTAATSSLILVSIASFLLWLLVHAGLVTAFIFGVYIYIDLTIYNRTREAEVVFDQYLSLVSENMKGGLSLEKALWEANRPEFGTLSQEIQLISKRVATGEDIADALRELTLKYDSPMLRRSLNLIIESMRAGGSITELLDRIVSNIKDTKLIKQEMIATNTNYMIFISAIVLFVAPLLFALSSQLLIIFGSFSSEIGSSATTAGGGLSLSISELSITPKQFLGFARSALLTIALCSSMIVSVVKQGDIKGGIKYMPLYGGISVLVFTLLNMAFTSVFAGMFT